MHGGNIEDSGAKALCFDYCYRFEDVLELITE
jgi:hypothetical protein